MLKPFKPFFILVLVFMLISPVARASENSPPGRWWQLPAMTKQLELNSEQIDALENLYYEHNRKLIRLKNDVESEQFELEILMEAESLDVDKALAQHDRLENARGKLAKERFGYFLEIRQILGAEKFRKLVEMKKQRMKRKRGADTQ